MNIDKGIPIPTGRNPKTGLSEMLRALQYGDSFVAPIAWRQQVYTIAKANGMTVCVRKVSDIEIRIWKTNK